MRLLLCTLILSVSFLPVLRATDFEWEVITLNDEIIDIHFKDHKYGYMAGSNGLVLKTENGGDTTQ